MRHRIAECLEGTAFLLLVFLSAAWTYFFYLILTRGEIICGEPNRVWLAIEFFLTLGVCGFGLFLFANFLKRKSNEGRK